MMLMLMMLMLLAVTEVLTLTLSSVYLCHRLEKSLVNTETVPRYVGDLVLDQSEQKYDQLLCPLTTARHIILIIIYNDIYRTSLSYITYNYIQRTVIRQLPSQCYSNAMSIIIII